MSSKRNQPKRKRNGEGTIYQLSTTKKWVAQYVVDKKRKTITGNTYDEVKAKLDKVKVEIREKTYIEKDGKTIGAILEENLKSKERKNRVRQSTLLRDRNSATVILNHPIATIPVQKCTRQDIQDFLDDMAQKYSNSYIDKIYTHLANVYKRATIDHLVNENLFIIGAIEKPKSIKDDKVVRALTREEQAKFVAKLKDTNYHDDYKDVFFFLLETGMRVGEVLALERSDIDIEKNVIHVTKTLSRDKYDRPILAHSTKTKAGMRDVPLTEHLKQLVRKNTNFRYLFTLPDTRFISTSTINTHFKKIMKDCEIEPDIRERKRKNGDVIRESTSKLSTHVLRHTFITRCVEQGMPQKVLQTIVRS